MLYIHYFQCTDRFRQIEKRFRKYGETIITLMVFSEPISEKYFSQVKYLLLSSIIINILRIYKKYTKKSLFFDVIMLLLTVSEFVLRNICLR